MKERRRLRKMMMSTTDSSCRKVAYTDEDFAKARAAASKDLKGYYNAYKCNRGNHWHIGHVPRKEQTND